MCRGHAETYRFERREGKICRHGVPVEKSWGWAEILAVFFGKIYAVMRRTPRISSLLQCLQ